MSFLFKSKKQQQQPPPPPQQQLQSSGYAPRLISSSHGPSTSAPPGGLNGKPGSQTHSAGQNPTGNPNPLQSTSSNHIPSSSGGPREPLTSSASHTSKAYQQPAGVRPRPSDNELARHNGNGATPQQQAPRPQQTTAPAEKYYYPIDPSSPFPWSLRLTNYTPGPGQSYDAFSPLPRYGAAVNSTCDRDKQIYVFGGLMGTEPTNDFWVLDCSGLLKTISIAEIDDRMKGDLAVPKQTDTGTVFTTLSFRKVKPKGKAPSARVGHAALLAGNAFIVFGGDTPTKPNDKLDDTLYFFNTAENQMSWTSPECRNRPAGRYGHTLSLIGNRIYLFGGQCEHIFFNDTHAYDLNKIQTDPSWSQVKLSPNAPCPPPRTNHSMTAWNDKLYLFGGTDGVTWYNDVWCFDPAEGSWTEMNCIGYIPLAREGHSAALVDDMMYVIGGRVRDGAALRELAAFKISTGRWFSFQNMGIPPSARSGHSMTNIDNQVVIVGGHSDALEVNELRYAYVLDTKKIAFDSAPTQNQSVSNRSQQSQRQSTPGSRKNTADSLNGPDKPGGVRGGGSVAGSRSQTPSHQAGKVQEPVSGSRLPRATPGPAAPPVGGHTRLTSTGRNTPVVQSENEPKRSASSLGHGETPGVGANTGPIVSRVRSMSKTKDSQPHYQAYNPNLASQSQSQAQPTPATTISQSALPPRTESREGHGGNRQTGRAPMESAQGMHVTPVAKSAALTAPPVTAPGSTTTRHITPNTASATPTPIDSGLGSYGSSPVMTQSQPPRDEESMKAVDDLKEQIKRLQLANSWYAGEVALASKAGYTPNAFPGSGLSGSTGARFSPSLDNRASISNPESLLPQISEEERPLVQLLLRTRSELSQVQGRIDGEAHKAANRIAEMEKQRDRAIEEAVYFKAKFASFRSPSSTPVGERGGSAASLGGHGRQSVTPSAEDVERASGLDRRLAEAVASRSAASREIDALRQSLDAEKKASAVAQENARASQEQMAALNSYQQRTSSEIEGLKSQLHEATQRLRDEVARANAADGREKMAQIDEADARRKLSAFLGDDLNDAENTVGRERDVNSEAGKDPESDAPAIAKKSGFEALIVHLRASVSTSADRAETAERRVKEERERADEAEKVLGDVKAELGQLQVKVQGVMKRAEDAEALSVQHAAEAVRQRSIVDGGLERLVTRDSAAHETTFKAKISVLESQLSEAEALMASSLADTRTAEESLRQAQERIAGLETFQATTSLENLKVRDQLQSATADSGRLGADMETMYRRLDETTQDRDTLRIQLDTLSAFVEEHGLKEDGMGSNSEGGADSSRVADLENRLAVATHARSELESEWQRHEGDLQAQWTSRLDKLENDYQSATRQVTSLEQIVAQMTNRTRRVEIRAKQFKELNHELRMRLEYAESRLLSYMSQDMEPSGDRDLDDGDDTALSASIGRLRATNGNSSHSRGHSSLSLSSTDDYGLSSGGGVTKGHNRLQGSLESASSGGAGSRNSKRQYAGGSNNGPSALGSNPANGVYFGGESDEEVEEVVNGSGVADGLGGFRQNVHQTAPVGARS